MNTESKPPCFCGDNNWQPHGCSISSYLINEGYKCHSCGATASYIQQRGGNVFLVWNGANEEAWINGPCRNVWAVRADEIRKLEDKDSEKKLKFVIFTLGFDAHKQDLTDEQWKLWREEWDRLDKEHKFKVPDELKIAPELPRAPISVYAFVWRHEKWEKVDPVKSASLPVPEHPLRISTFRTMAEVFAKVIEKTGAMFSPKETENEYCGSDIEPWFSFKVGITDFKVGMRKRVFALKYSGKQPVNALAPLAKRDNVTFSDNQIHAWGTEKLIEYMCAAVEACNGRA